MTREAAGPLLAAEPSLGEGGVCTFHLARPDHLAEDDIHQIPFPTEAAASTVADERHDAWRKTGFVPAGDLRPDLRIRALPKPFPDPGGALGGGTAP